MLDSMESVQLLFVALNWVLQIKCKERIFNIMFKKFRDIFVIDILYLLLFCSEQLKISTNHDNNAHVNII